MSSDGPQPSRVLLGGGIGAGKSSIASLFGDAGFSLVEADRIGAEVLSPGTAETSAVAAAWPEAVRGDVVDRSALARIVFSSESALAQLEAITHPAIRRRIESIAANAPDMVLVEVPLMTLSPEGEWIRIAVVADEDLRIARAVARGGDPDDVRRRVESQVDEDAWVEWADVVITNNAAWSETEKVVGALLDELMT